MHSLCQIFKWSFQWSKHLFCIETEICRNPGVTSMQKHVWLSFYAYVCDLNDNGWANSNTTKVTLVWVFTCAVMNLLCLYKSSWDTTLWIHIYDGWVTEQSQPQVMQQKGTPRPIFSLELITWHFFIPNQIASFY